MEHKLIGLSSPARAGSDRVNIQVWDVGDAERHAQMIGTAEFTLSDAKRFAAKLLEAAS